jgi:tRNA threonylcarbamoyladenosine biosynthesis protein TsaB
MSSHDVKRGLAAAIDCGGDYLSVALVAFHWEAQTLAFETLDTVTEHRGHRHADVVLGELARMLSRHGKTVGDLDLVAAGRGPGGFTGIRVGLATAQGLAFGLGKPLWTVCSLETLAMNALGSSPLVVPMIDAKRGQIYTGLFRLSDDGRIDTLCAPEVVEPAGVLGRYRDMAGSENLCVLGSGSLVYELNTSPQPEDHQPMASRAAEIALRAWAVGGFSREGTTVDPVYLRRSDAEIDYERRHGVSNTGSE